MRGARRVRTAAPPAVLGAVLIALPACLPLVAGPGTAAAQEAAEIPALTLADALDRAARHNPRYRRARNETGLSGPARRAAWGAFLPSLELGLGTSLDFNRRLRSTDNFGNPIENPVSDWRTTSGSSQWARGSVTLFEGGRRFDALEAAGARADARSAALRAEGVAVEAAVTRAYLEAARGQALLAVEEELLAGRERDLEVARRRFELAGVTRVDVLAAEQSLREQEQAVRAARSRHEKALLALRSAVGDPELDAGRVAPPAPPALDGDARLPPVDSLMAAALAANPELSAQRARVRAADADADAAGGSRWPSVSLNYSVNQNTFADQRSALFDPYPDDSRFVSTGLSVRVPLFSRFQIRDQEARARVEADNARETLRETRLAVQERVRSWAIDVGTAREGLRIARLARELAEERLELAREQYRLGTRTFSELQRDIDAAVAARRAAADALYDYLAAEASLREAVGGGGLERP